jgi:predicted NBD/HSP70 family sugar kinase
LGDVSDAEDLKGGRVKNRRRVLGLLRENGALSQADISDQTGLSRATVSSLISELRQHRLVVNQGFRPELARTGRPPAMVALTESVGAAVGINITAEVIHVAVGNVGLEMLAEREVRPDRFAIGSEPEETLQLTASIVRELLAAAEVEASQVVGVTVAVPASIDSRSGTVGISTFLPDWHRTTPAAVLEALLGLPVLLENDANLSALAEAVSGAAEGAANVLYVSGPTGIGAGLILNGRLWRGAFGGAGEITHMIVRPGGPLCFCGRRGCLAAVVDGATIVEEVRTSLGRRVTASEFDPEALDVPSMGLDRELALVVEWARRGDPISSRVLGDAGHELGFAIANVCQIINPERVVVGGTLTTAGDIFMDPFIEAVHGLTTQLPGWPVPIVRGRWQERAELVGAIALGVRADDSRFAERFSTLVERTLLDRPPRHHASQAN